MKEQQAVMKSEEQLGQLSLAQLRELRNQAKKNQKQTPAPQLVARERGGSAPLSYAQERLFFLDELGLVGSLYNMPLPLRLQGKLDVHALERSFAELIRRHESLRTRFESVGGNATQLIDPAGPFPLKIQDLSGLPDDDQVSQVRKLSREEAERPIDLAKGPLLRASLLKLAPKDHVLLMTMHHIVSDGWSLGILNQEIGALYGAFSQGRASPLPELPIQYADYAIWQREWLQGETLQKQLSYWSEQLDGAPPQLQLPTDRPRPAVASFNGAFYTFKLPAVLRDGLEKLAKKEEATFFMVVLAAYQVLLSRYSRQEDIVVGSVIAGRNHTQTEELIGFFVNTLILRTVLSGNPSFRELLVRVKEVTLGAYAHQDLPFAKLVMELRPERNLTRQPIFQAALALQNFPQAQLELAGLTWTRLENEYQASMFDLTLHLYESAGELQGTFEYSTDLFDEATIARMAGVLQTLMEGAVSSPECPIQQLPLLNEAGRNQLLQTFNDARVAYPEHLTIHELFEEQVDRTPNDIAVVCDRQALTYAELNAKANQLARYLRDKGAGPDELVALYVRRGVEMVVSLLGILKAGAAYVPLDPNYPAERLQYLLKDATPRVVLTQARLKASLPATAAEVVPLDSDWVKIGAQPSGNLDLRSLGLRSHHLAYLIYTSGSTGKPKGVAIEHRNAVNLICWARSAMAHEVFEQTLQSTSLNFDLSVYECFVPLTIGGTLRIVEDALSLVNAPFEVTLVNTVPSAIAAVLESSSIPASTRVVNLAGEALKADLVERIFEQSSVERVNNLYGPSETTTYSTWVSMPREQGFNASIGRPVANTQIYILDQFRQIVPMGVIGEIYIGGAGVARGYLNRPELTAERFLRDPFTADPQAKMYKTGDLGRWLPDGTIEYLGRNDHQVKIRGYRIELGEIETQIARHDQVKEVAVIAREDVPGDKRLVAYVSGDRSAMPVATTDADSEGLRSEILTGWETLWEETYGGQNQSSASTFTGPTFVGWNSSYTGEPIPEAQMQEWLAGTVERIDALKPSKVLEIGCGVGLILQHVAPRCAVYVGTDISRPAIGQLRQWTKLRADLQHVELMHRSANELKEFESGSFDTVILNSVVQYFPDIEYLLAAIREAVRLVTPGGKVFLGDIRHLGLLPMFHTAVQLGKASASVKVGQLKKRIARSMTQEKELLIEPEFFRLLPEIVPGVSTVELQLKRGRAANELTRYRYDVVLHTGETAAPSGEHSVPVSWQFSAAEFEASLQQNRPTRLSVVAIPNSRLSREAAALKLIVSSEDNVEVGAIRRQLDEQQFEGVDPESFWQWADQYGYVTNVAWDVAGLQESFTVQLSDRSASPQLSVGSATRAPMPKKPATAYANDPLEHSFRQQLIPQLREFLKGRLPEYMIPSVWVAMKQLPLTPNGKLDRNALPAPDSRPEEMGEYVAPRTEIEATLAGIWAKVLRVDQVGVNDNFFELGGHSLLGMKLTAKVVERFKVSLTVISVFQHPTIDQMAKVVEALQLLNEKPIARQGVELEAGAF